MNRTSREHVAIWLVGGLIVGGSLLGGGCPAGSPPRALRASPYRLYASAANSSGGRPTLRCLYRRRTRPYSGPSTSGRRTITGRKCDTSLTSRRNASRSPRLQRRRTRGGEHPTNRGGARTGPPRGADPRSPAAPARGGAGATAGPSRHHPTPRSAVPTGTRRPAVQADGPGLSAHPGRRAV